MGLLRRSPTRGHLPLWLVSPMQATPAFRGPSPTAECAAARSRAGPPLGGAFWDGGAERWCNYYRYAVAKRTFVNLDHHVWRVAYKWAKRRYPRKNRRCVAGFFRADANLI